MKAEPEVGKPGRLSNRDGQRPCKRIKFVKGVAVTNKPEKKIIRVVEWCVAGEEGGRPRDRQCTRSTKRIIEGKGINK